jgi:TetR/AcrR family acrAB operon transcriptional repressor
MYVRCSIEMARRTKEEAQETRERLLDTAEALFQRDGVSATSLNDIACAAGLTRGAVYWHFRDKADLFHAMLERAYGPLHAGHDVAFEPGHADPLELLRRHVDAVLRAIAGDTRLCRIVDITENKVEYVNDLLPAMRHRADVRRGYVEQLSQVVARAQALGQVPREAPSQALALGLFAMIDGLVRHWVLEPGAFDLVATGRVAVDRYLRGLAG